MRSVTIGGASTKSPGKKPRRTPDDLERLIRRGERIKEIRVKAGHLSGNQAVLALGVVNSGDYSRIEGGKKDMECLLAERLADAFHVSMDVLLGRVPMPERIDRFPARAAVAATKEFSEAPPEVRKYFLETDPLGAEEWSVVKWTHELDELVAYFRRGGTLPSPATSSQPVRRR